MKQMPNWFYKFMQPLKCYWTIGGCWIELDGGTCLENPIFWVPFEDFSRFMEWQRIP